MSYGWSRAELVGALLNGSFLLALCVYVMLELIPRFVRPRAIDNESFGTQFVIVASLGLAINSLGTALFWCTGTKSFHSHSHGHADADAAHSHRSDDALDDDDDADADHVCAGGHSHAHSHSLRVDLLDADYGARRAPPPRKPARRRAWNLNRYAVFLHYLGDALSSLVVLIIGIVLRYNPTASWAAYADAGASALIVVFLLVSTLPLVKRTALIMMQMVPPELDSVRLAALLRGAAPGVASLHNLHVWRLDQDTAVGTVHVALAAPSYESGAQQSDVRARLTRVFHDAGVQNATIQLEHTDEPCALATAAPDSLRATDAAAVVAAAAAAVATAAHHPAVAMSGTLTGK